MKNKVLEILLIEDNISTALEIEMYLTEFGHEVLATFERGQDAVSFVEKNKVDLAIVDITLKGEIDGIVVAHYLKDKGIPFIFSTGLDCDITFSAARKLSPISYLVKPINKFTIQSCIDVFLRCPSHNNNIIAPQKYEDSSVGGFTKDSFFIKTKSVLQKIRFEDIDYIQSDRNYCIFHVKGKMFVAKISLNSLMKKLPPFHFVRIHQSYVIPFKGIENIHIHDYTVEIEEGTTLPLGQTYKSPLMKRLNRI